MVPGGCCPEFGYPGCICPPCWACAGCWYCAYSIIWKVLSLQGMRVYLVCRAEIAAAQDVWRVSYATRLSNIGEAQGGVFPRLQK